MLKRERVREAEAIALQPAANSSCRLRVGNTFCLLSLQLIVPYVLYFACFRTEFEYPINFTSFFFSHFIAICNKLAQTYSTCFKFFASFAAKAHLRTVFVLSLALPLSLTMRKPTLNVETHLRPGSSQPEIAFIRFVYCHQLFIHTIILAPRSPRSSSSGVCFLFPLPPTLLLIRPPLAASNDP